MELDVLTIHIHPKHLQTQGKAGSFLKGLQAKRLRLSSLVKIESGAPIIF